MDRHGQERACGTSSGSSNLVFVASRKSGHGWILGYFDQIVEIPKDWTIHPEPMDISDIMASMRCTKAEALVTMNAHWRR